ncbi:unnamed protein product [Moneuplotes crassus]|uniref:Uncharacterized protein n=1 Tax=Euplotes crassus TaxID=5936 RepID=A0AAD1U778_EUPCR|nr:unnamed protein product [Moneuplotes crassus]
MELSKSKASLSREIGLNITVEKNKKSEKRISRNSILNDLINSRKTIKRREKSRGNSNKKHKRNKRSSKGAKLSLQDMASQNIKFPISQKKKNAMIHLIYETRLTDQLCMRPRTNLRSRRVKKSFNIKIKQHSPLPERTDINSSAIIMPPNNRESSALDLVQNFQRKKIGKMKLVLQQKYWPNTKIIKHEAGKVPSQKKMTRRRKKRRDILKKIKNEIYISQDPKYQSLEPMTEKNSNSQFNQGKSKLQRRKRNNFMSVISNSKSKIGTSVDGRGGGSNDLYTSKEATEDIEDPESLGEKLKNAINEKLSKNNSQKNTKNEKGANEYFHREPEGSVQNESFIILKTTKGNINVTESKESLNEKPNKANIYQRLFSTNYDKESEQSDGTKNELYLKRANTQGSDRYIKKIEKERKKVEEWKRSQRKINKNNKYIETLKSDKSRLNGKSLPRPAEVRAKHNSSYRDNLTNRILQRGTMSRENSKVEKKKCNYFSLA